MRPRHIFSAVVILFASCQSNSTEEKAPADVPKEEVVERKTNWVGLYEDTLPCADCPGILMQLDLRSDSTYVLRQKYIERDSVPYGRIGRWSVSGNELSLGTEVEWRSGPNGLERLGKDGQPLVTELPNSMSRVANFGSSPMHLTGAYVYFADSHSFKPCGSSYAIPVAMDEAGTKGAGSELERTYGKKVKNAPEPLYVQVTATMRTGPAMEGDGTEEYLHIDQVDKVLEKQECP